MSDRIIGCRSEINYLMKKYQLTARKQYGQNFLVEPSVINKIVEELSEDDTVIEIGPGLGSLTLPMAEKCRRVIAIEIDEQLCGILREELKDYDNLEIRNEDILKTDLDAILNEVDGKAVIVSNLPYYITSEILLKLLTNSGKISRIIAMMQKEVAERFFKKEADKDYGPLQVIAPYYCEISVLSRVNKRNFLPQPKVDSAVLLFVTRPYHRQVSDEAGLLEVIRACYSQRRKIVLSNLINSGYHINKQQLNDINIKETARCEQLSLDDYISLCEVLEHD
ncbi:MAG: 16S rRNA (adenine(1518)-N(6)/adenine(1519)-N(6))-dimethyltransferase RsmA [Erysipelotrichaceae bacterium]|nr:16S rRNA (adenine(1518)-N(6)/adenine(1519)-N(6))-dimethyltransferase RsmA [Erysipelotrichaceae bacterium]